MKHMGKLSDKRKILLKHEPLLEDAEIAKARKLFGNRVMKARIEKDLTREELGSMIGKTMQHVRLIENGNRWPGMDVFFNICNVLQVSPVYLMLDYLTIEVPDTYERLFELLDKSAPRQAAIIVDMLELMARRMDSE